MLESIVKVQISQITSKIVDDLPNDMTNSRILVIHELKAFLKQIKELADPSAPKNTNLI